MPPLLQAGRAEDKRRARETRRLLDVATYDSQALSHGMFEILTATPRDPEHLIATLKRQSDERLVRWSGELAPRSGNM